MNEEVPKKEVVPGDIENGKRLISSAITSKLMDLKMSISVNRKFPNLAENGSRMQKELRDMMAAAKELGLDMEQIHEYVDGYFD